jgi:hypothetical protein
VEIFSGEPREREKERQTDRQREEEGIEKRMR